MLITHLQDLQEVTQDVHYENYRSERLAKGVAVNRKTVGQSNGNGTPGGSEGAGTDKERILQVRIDLILRHIVPWNSLLI